MTSDAGSVSVELVGPLMMFTGNECEKHRDNLSRKTENLLAYEPKLIRVSLGNLLTRSHERMWLSETEERNQPEERSSDINAAVIRHTGKTQRGHQLREPVRAIAKQFVEPSETH